MEHKWKRVKIKATPAMMRKLFEYVKSGTTSTEDLENVMSRLEWFAHNSCHTLTVEEFDEVIKKPA